MSYSGEHSVDYTNTNPDYWASVNEFFQNNAQNQQGETGIWIPNLEKQGQKLPLWLLALVVSGRQGVVTTLLGRSQREQENTKQEMQQAILLAQGKWKAKELNIRMNAL